MRKPYFFKHAMVKLGITNVWHWFWTRLRSYDGVYCTYFREKLSLKECRNSRIGGSQCGGSWMLIPDPGSDFFPSRIRTVSIPDPWSSSKEFRYFNPPKKQKKNGFEAQKNMIRVVHPGSGCWLSPIPDPGSRGQKGTQSRIPDPDPQHWWKLTTLSVLSVAAWPTYYRSITKNCFQNNCAVYDKSSRKIHARKTSFWKKFSSVCGWLNASASLPTVKHPPTQLSLMGRQMKPCWMSKKKHFRSLYTFYKFCVFGLKQYF